MKKVCWIAWVGLLSVLSGGCAARKASTGPSSRPISPEVRRYDTRVSGIFLQHPEKTAVVGRYVYLAEILSAAGNSIQVSGLDPAKAPRCLTGAGGEFLFENVPPKTYALVSTGPFGVVLLREEKTDREVILVLRDHDKKKIGRVFIEPVPGKGVGKE